MQKPQFGLRLLFLVVVLVAVISSVMSARMSEERSELGVYRIDVEARITRDRMQQRAYQRDEEEHERPEGFYDARIEKLEQRIASNQKELDRLDN